MHRQSIATFPVSRAIIVQVFTIYYMQFITVKHEYLLYGFGELGRAATNKVLIAILEMRTVLSQSANHREYHVVLG